MFHPRKSKNQKIPVDPWLSVPCLSDQPFWPMTTPIPQRSPSQSHGQPFFWSSDPWEPRKWLEPLSHLVLVAWSNFTSWDFDIQYSLKITKSQELVKFDMLDRCGCRYTKRTYKPYWWHLLLGFITCLEDHPTDCNWLIALLIGFVRDQCLIPLI